MSAYTLHLCTSAGSERLTKAEFIVAADFTASGTNYWTVTVRRRRMHPNGTRQTYGEQVGNPYSLATRSMSAGVAASIYSSSTGLSLDAGDELWATYESTGTPAVLANPSIRLTRQRQVR